MCLPYSYPKAIANAVASSAGSKLNCVNPIVLFPTVFIVLARANCVTCILLVPVGGALQKTILEPEMVYARPEPFL